MMLAILATALPIRFWRTLTTATVASSAASTGSPPGKSAPSAVTLASRASSGKASPISFCGCEEGEMPG